MAVGILNILEAGRTEAGYFIAFRPGYGKHASKIHPTICLAMQGKISFGEVLLLSTSGFQLSEDNVERQ